MRTFIFTLLCFSAVSVSFAQGTLFSAYALSADLLIPKTTVNDYEKDDFLSYSYYESGELKAIKPIVDGKFEGELLSFYPDGTLRRREFFENGKSMGGVCFDMDGKILPYEPFMKFAELKGKEDAADFVDGYTSFIFRTKKSALLDEVKVILNINQHGKLVGYKFDGHADKGTQERVDYVLRQMPDWHPAIEEGVYVPMDFELTIRK
ncbi:hypothetical protein KI659_14235 [Litoribacter alkaliphilus]|uniref:TonB C-terminal domain-containing protein n=1 Tax=Litoribacter ruber TaxID=702568 RepID=A0AAP2CJP9_9BACT|nr:hypothetical protein [Litoribacter alkaliphilus]MBS9525175.1 hypothetical protein [Litoribacter alkaliphilus]